MSRFIQDGTGVIVSVDDSKDERFASGWNPAPTDSEDKGSRPRAKK